jgi:hypothetical protein
MTAARIPAPPCRVFAGRPEIQRARSPVIHRPKPRTLALPPSPVTQSVPCDRAPICADWMGDLFPCSSSQSVLQTRNMPLVASRSKFAGIKEAIMLALRGFCGSRRVILTAIILFVGSAADAASGYRFEVLHSFNQTINGPANARGKLVEDGLGTLYGVTSVGAMTTLLAAQYSNSRMTANSPFCMNSTDTEYEPVGLILATDGSLRHRWERGPRRARRRYLPH